MWFVFFSLFWNPTCITTEDHSFQGLSNKLYTKKMCFISYIKCKHLYKVLLNFNQIQLHNMIKDTPLGVVCLHAAIVLSCFLHSCNKIYSFLSLSSGWWERLFIERCIKSSRKWKSHKNVHLYLSSIFSMKESGAYEKPIKWIRSADVYL